MEMIDCKALYKDDAINQLADLFDYVINDNEFDPDKFANIFQNSQEAKLIENYNPHIISHYAGYDLGRMILETYSPQLKLKEREYSIEKTKEYWAGWALSQYQYETKRRFKVIFKYVKLSEIIKMYNPYHTASIEKFIDALDKKIKERNNNDETNLAKYRKFMHMSQSELSQKSGVSLRMIQLYEQGVNDLNKASFDTVYKLSKALCINVDDLIDY